jgi:hypothetical protein
VDRAARPWPQKFAWPHLRCDVNQGLRDKAALVGLDHTAHEMVEEKEGGSQPLRACTPLLLPDWDAQEVAHAAAAVYKASTLRNRA